MIWETIVALIVWGAGIIACIGGYWLMKSPIWRIVLIVLAILLTAGAFTVTGGALGKAQSEQAIAVVLRGRFAKILSDLSALSDAELRQEYLNDLRGLDIFSDSVMARKIFEQHANKWRLKLIQMPK